MNFTMPQSSSYIVPANQKENIETQIYYTWGQATFNTVLLYRANNGHASI